MSCEYNHSIQFDLDHLSQYEDVAELEEKKMELDHIYAQVSEYEQHKVATTVLVNALKSKADEYEAKAKAFDELRYIMDYHYPDKEDREGVRGYQHPKVALKNIGDVIEEYESGESE